jgi:hypothetical protein
LTLGLALVQYLILHRRQYHLFRGKRTCITPVLFVSFPALSLLPAPPPATPADRQLCLPCFSGPRCRGKWQLLAVDGGEAVEGLEEVKRGKLEVHENAMPLWTGQDVVKESQTEARAVCRWAV